MTRLLASVQKTRPVRSVFFDWPNAQIPTGGMSDGQNVEPRGDSPEFASVGKSPGWRKYISDAVDGTGPVMDVREYVVAAGTRSVMACSTTRATKYNTSNNQFEDVTGGANLLTATASVPIFTAVLNDLFIVGDENDAPRKYTGAAWGLLGGSPPTCAGWDVYEGHLLGWNVSTSEFTAQWSELNDPETWGSGEAGSFSFRDHNLLALLAGAKLGQHFVFYKEQLGGVYAMTYVGGAVPMVQELVIPNFGVFSTRGVASHGGVHYTIGSDEKFYAVTLGGKEEIAQGIRKRAFSRINWNARRAAYVTVDPLRSLILFCIPTGASTTPDRAYLFNYRTGGTGECEWPFACATTIRDPETTIINDLSGTIDSLVGTIDELSSLGKDVLLMGGTGSTGYIYKRQGESKDGTAMDSWVVTPWEGVGAGRHLRMRGWEVDAINTGHVFIEAGTANHLADAMTFTPLTHASPENFNRADGNLSARWIAARFRSNTDSDQVTWEVSGHRPDLFPVGRR